MTTLNPAQFLRREATMGSVEEGKVANLVVLNANPLLDVKNLNTISAVFLNGKHFDRATLDTMVADVADAYAKQIASAAFVDRTHVE